MAHEHWNDKFRDGELREQEQQAAIEQSRRASETLYLVDPYNAPELVDSSLGYGYVARSTQELNWAEARLTELGFRKQEQDRVKSYVNKETACVVYADPRRLGEISFVVYRLPFPKRRPRITSLFSMSRRFRILDSWKNDLQSKYNKRVLAAIDELEPKAKP